MQSLIGTGVALVTPFNSDYSVDVEALQNLVEYTIAGGVEYLVVLGTTGESATLSKEEKQLVKRTVIKANKQRLPLVLGVGGNNTHAVLEELTEENLEGFDAILSVSPYYNKPTQEGIYQHFKLIAEKSPLPIILYNVPGRTGSNMAVSTVVRLANEYSNIIGIKEAAGSIVQGMELIRQSTRKDFLVISGDDAIALPLVLAGGAGVISVIGQGTPQKFTDMIRLGLKGEIKEAFELQYQLMPIIDMIFEQGNPAGIKEILKVEGVMKDTLRLPLVNVDADLASRLEKEYKSLK
ncbi:4-hydroxy-tetrahydrodipicolinate synthase [Myroides marinus]|jgi:4-hydroxy-tetrahydrodipicolinate synthase|uniref:4-hydroxy-tetrahydrodipicolinate synthase n=1 Tax=Myroides marinus TaxID=703342 RepID=A0A1H6VE52_9FLAO|nr:4-hydroxy-tetrahydrodipicolinate synthase [Myroides marinus]MDR0195594.1 4-hydroxy-tetrahydrodipicolinate synthase [Myroides sp.]MDM1348477.1 4-hydroxy-tetrahydrodipicolinate synthase [Myroides marinus]MDM1351956.1 4-hydroxy-tetrahydrodipicolinate synthase [Myroides marinus]MDM1355531.1 4-hydroxy-tetrahydrodipicolinate synthase [Myroides marinus]MDM1359151.1 4-hydroxy-tetrahydrodipicolinate synthase [Myroides marinus]